MKRTGKLTVLSVAILFGLNTAVHAQTPVLNCDTITPVTFSDVPETHLHYDTIGCIGTTGVFAPYAENAFRPYWILNRNEGAELIFNALNLAGAGLTADLNDMQTRTEAIVTALREIGVVAGYPDGTFGGDRPMPRQQFATLIVRAAEHLNQPLTASEHPFVDVVANNPHADAIGKLAGANVITGYPGAVFRTSQPITRAQAASMLTNWLTTVAST